MEMRINFPGGKRVTSTYKGFSVETDQPKSEGGDDSAPEPYDLFLSSIGTCAGVYIVYFCESRDIPTDDISMTLRFERNETSHLMEKIAIDIHLPPAFPDKIPQGRDSGGRNVHSETQPGPSAGNSCGDQG